MQDPFKKLDYAAAIQAMKRDGFLLDLDQITLDCREKLEQQVQAGQIAKGRISSPWLGDEVIEKTIYWLKGHKKKRRKHDFTKQHISENLSGSRLL